MTGSEERLSLVEVPPTSQCDCSWKLPTAASLLPSVPCPTQGAVGTLFPLAIQPATLRLIERLNLIQEQRLRASWPSCSSKSTSLRKKPWEDCHLSPPPRKKSETSHGKPVPPSGQAPAWPARSGQHPHNTQGDPRALLLNSVPRGGTSAQRCPGAAPAAGSQPCPWAGEGLGEGAGWSRRGGHTWTCPCLRWADINS